MSNDVKGMSEIYDLVAEQLSDSHFVEWIPSNAASFSKGQFCLATVSYAKRKQWYLEEANYDAYNEANSTWYVREMVGPYPETEREIVKKHFEIENDERLVTTNSKVRPVILIQRSRSDWLNPKNSQQHVATWLCLPLFTYKPRHSQAYVLDDQRLNSSIRVYIPPAYSRCPGPPSESAARFLALQMLPETGLMAMKCYSLEKKMSVPYRLSKLALRVVMYHLYSTLDLFEELDDAGAQYYLFREGVNRLIDSAEVS